MVKRFAIAAAMLLAALLVSPGARSAGMADDIPQAQSEWELSFAPYAWVLFITGENTLGANTIDVDTDLFEIIDATLGDGNELYFFAFEKEIRRGRLGIFTDFLWGKLNIDESIVRSDNPIAGLNVDIVADANVWVEMMLLEPGVAYEIFKTGSAGSFKDPVAYERSTAVDVLAGARYWYLKPEVDLAVTATVSIPALGLSRTGGGRVEAERTYDWWDPYVGLRVRHQRGEGRELVLRGDVGGFGAGSDFTWQLEGIYNMDTQLLGYDVTAQMGYRALYADYEEGSGPNTFAVDWLWHGPVMGMKFSW